MEFKQIFSIFLDLSKQYFLQLTLKKKKLFNIEIHTMKRFPATLGDLIIIFLYAVAKTWEIGVNLQKLVIAKTT